MNWAVAKFNDRITVPMSETSSWPLHMDLRSKKDVQCSSPLELQHPFVLLGGGLMHV